jgi:radical SAM protein with 4Fe4S-binding SPASM domain
MSRKLRRCVEILTDKGIRGLCVVATEVLEQSARQASYKNRLLRRIVYPKLTTVYLELTNDCNLNCKMCPFRLDPRKTGYMSWSLFTSCVNQLSKIGLKNLWLHFGGESLLHPNFKDCMKYAIYHRDHGKIQNASLITNGMLFNQSMADLVVDLKVDSIGFSIDGIGQVNDNIRVGSKYSVVERNIKYLIRRRGKSKKPEVFLSMTDYGKTKEQEMDVYREWAPVVDGISICPRIFNDGTVDNQDAFFRGHKSVKPPAFCSSPFETMVVSWNGQIAACCVDTSFKAELGDTTRESLKQIWKDSRYQALRKVALANAFPVGSPCHTCTFWKTTFEAEEEPFLGGTATIHYNLQWKNLRRRI